MSRLNREQVLSAISPDLPDDALLNETQVAAFLGFSTDTLRRLEDPPKRIQLSKRRFGWRLGEIRRWLKAKEAAA
jgi:predicted DNA-binding transcriptional regulator AlpA